MDVSEQLQQNKIGSIEVRFSIPKKIDRNPNHGSPKPQVLSENILETYREQKSDFLNPLLPLHLKNRK